MKDDFTEFEKGIFRLASSVDSLLLNGTQFGIIVSVGNGGFLQKVSDSLTQDLAALENSVSPAHPVRTQRTGDVLTQVRMLVVDLIDLMNRLAMFRSFALSELRAIVPRLILCRDEIVRRLQELEICLGTSKRLQADRSKESAANIDAFLKNLPEIFEGEWRQSNSTGKVTAASKK